MATTLRLVLVIATCLAVTALAKEYSVTLRSAPLAEVYKAPRHGRVALTVHTKDGRQLAAGGSTEDEKFTMTSTHTYKFDVDVEPQGIDGVAVAWTQATDLKDSQRLFPLGFKVRAADGETVSLCRRKASDGIRSGSQYIYRRWPACFRDLDQN